MGERERESKRMPACCVERSLRSLSFFPKLFLIDRCSWLCKTVSKWQYIFPAFIGRVDHYGLVLNWIHVIFSVAVCCCCCCDVANCGCQPFSDMTKVTVWCYSFQIIMRKVPTDKILCHSKVTWIFSTIFSVYSICFVARNHFSFGCKISHENHEFSNRSLKTLISCFATFASAMDFRSEHIFSNICQSHVKRDIFKEFAVAPVQRPTFREEDFINNVTTKCLRNSAYK